MITDRDPDRDASAGIARVDSVDGVDGVDGVDDIDLADERLGAVVVAASDEFFGPAEALLRPGAPESRPGVYTERGAWVDGWETRRRRGDVGGHDWCLVRLGASGIVQSVVVDTAHFTGNAPELCWVEGCAATGYPDVTDLERAEWHEVVPRTPLRGGTRHRLDSACDRRLTHLRLSIAPDGGVARLRAHGEVIPDPRDLAGLPFDLAGTENGGVVTGASDHTFAGHHHLTLPDPPRSMADGWETRRRRGDPAAHDWAVIRLATEGEVRAVEVDTRFFKGNAPASCELDGGDGDRWTIPMLPMTALLPNTRHRFRLDPDVTRTGVTHVRLGIHPDGGLARLRCYGEPTPAGWERLAARWLDTLPRTDATRELHAVCGSTRWAEGMAARRPFGGLAEAAASAREVWNGLGRDDWLEAFAAHPRIGDRRTAGWSRAEQAGIGATEPDVLAALEDGNREYERRFEHVFLVCATGKTAEQMLALLRARLGNDPDTELSIAAGEQVKITAIRLERLFRPA